MNIYLLISIIFTKKEGDVENDETIPDYLTVKRGINLIGIYDLKDVLLIKKEL